MRCAAALSTHPVPSQATGDVIADLFEYGSTPPDLLLVIATPEFSGAAEDIIATINSLLRPAQMLLVVSSGVLAAGSEVTTSAGLGLWACWSETPTTDPVRVIGLQDDQGGSEDAEREFLRRSQAVVLLGDPGAEDVTTILDKVITSLPHQDVSGGLLSAARGPVRIIDAEGRTHSAVAVCFQTSSVDVALGHGSVALSESMTVTAVVGTRLMEIDSRPALDVAHEVIGGEEPEARAQTARDLAIAVHFGDDSIVDVHRVLGVDRSSGALALTGELPIGSRVSFHRQDRDSGIAGLDVALGGSRARGALVFSCSSLDAGSERAGAGDLGLLVEVLGTAAFAGVQVSTVIGPAGGQVGLRHAPLSAAIFGRDHH